MSDGRYVIRGGERGYDRLQVLARAVAPGTAALFDRVGIGEGMRCCDLGCGPGVVSFTLAERVGPSGHVDAIDMDEVKLDLARQEAVRRGIANVTFRVANVTEWADPGANDVVYARSLLQTRRAATRPPGPHAEIAAASSALAAATADPGTIIAGPATFQIWARREA